MFGPYTIELCQWIIFKHEVKSSLQRKKIFGNPNSAIDSFIPFLHCTGLICSKNTIAISWYPTGHWVAFFRQFTKNSDHNFRIRELSQHRMQFLFLRMRHIQIAKHIIVGKVLVNFLATIILKVIGLIKIIHMLHIL